MNDCDIKLEDTSLSRYHCCLYYDTVWTLLDGDGKKLSTNGTWLFVEQFLDIYDGMVFKAGETLFKSRIINERYNSA